MRNRINFCTLVTFFLTALGAATSVFAQVVTPTPVPSPVGSLVSNTIQLTGVVNASNFVLGNTTQGPQIYGGILGPISNTANPSLCDTSNFNVAGGQCNNCNPDPTNPTACNAMRIYGNLQFTLTFQVQSQITAGTYYAYLCYQNTSGTTTTDSTQFNPTNGVVSGPVGPLQTGGSYSLMGTWGELCTAAGLDTSGGTGDPCDAAATETGIDMQMTVVFGPYVTGGGTSPCSSASYTTTIPVSILGETTSGGGTVDTINPSSDTSDSAIIAFNADAGDEEVVITPTVQGSCPSGSWQAARVFYWQDSNSAGSSLTGFQNATYGAPASQDLPFNPDCSQNGTWSITGLTNDTGYFFDISLLDMANNNFFLIDPNWIVTFQTCGAYPLNIFDGGAISDYAGCPYYAVPSKVEGLLPNELNCAIATAAFGSPLEPAVKTLRQFRNEFLYPYKLGRKLAKLYYRNSPPYAAYIRTHDFAKSITRISLAPLWGFAWLSLYYTPLGVLLTLVATLAFCIVASRRYKRGDW